MKNAQKMVFVLLLAVIAGQAAFGQFFSYGNAGGIIVDSPDKNVAIKDVRSEQLAHVKIPATEDDVEEPPHLFAVIPQDTFSDENNVQSQEDKCRETDADIFSKIYYAKIESSGDVDWYHGNIPASISIRVILIPPANKDYDMQIFDDCGNAVKTCENRGNGAIESCTADISGYYYVKVYGYNNQYDKDAYYWVVSAPTGNCSVGLYGGEGTQNADCHETVYLNNAKISNNNKITMGYELVQDLWRPTGGVYAWWGYSGSVESGKNTTFNGYFNPPSDGWPENGTYPSRTFAVGYCKQDNYNRIDYGKDVGNPNPSVNCNQCQNECSYNGEKQCNGNYSQTCGNYDNDSCLEWGNNQYCQYGCENGQCKNCNSHSDYACFDNDVYWYNSCNQREDQKQECGNNEYAYYCKEDDVYRDYYIRGCDQKSCYQNVTTEKYAECGKAGCSNGACNDCGADNDHQSCYDHDVYWFNKCDRPTQMQQDCRIDCYEENNQAFCLNGCLGNFIVQVKNSDGQVETNATVSFKRDNQNEFQFAGLTDSGGKFSFSDLYPYQSCGGPYSFQAVTQNGVDCGILETKINEENDTDFLLFRCPLGKSEKTLVVEADAPEKILLGQTLQVFSTIRDQIGNTVEKALVGLIRSYNSIPLSKHSDSEGKANFEDATIPTGSHYLRLIANKIGYNFGESWKRVTVEPQTVQAIVRDSFQQPVSNAQILIDNNVVAYTNANGKASVSLLQQTTTLEARNTNDIPCGYRTVRPGEQANFICANNPQLRVDVDNNQGKAVANVAVFVDGNFVDYTNSFGFALIKPVQNGEQQIDILYKMDENEDILWKTKKVTISQELTIVQFLADSNATDFNQLSESDYNNIHEQFAFIPILVAAYVAIDVLSPYWDTYEWCECMNKYSDNPVPGGCPEILKSCVTDGVNYCQETVRNMNVQFVSGCETEVGVLGLDALPLVGGVGLVRHAGIELTNQAAKLGFNKLPETAIKIFEISRVKGENAIKMTGHEWSYYVTKTAEGLNQNQIWIRGKKLGTDVTKLIEDAYNSIKYGKEAAKKTVEGIGRNVIPENAPEHTERLLQYSKKALDQGIEPFEDGVEQLQKVYKREGINTKVGDEIVDNTMILKKGDTTFGWEHIKKRGHHNKIQKECHLSDSEEAVKEIIKIVVESGHKGNNPREIIYRPDGCEKDIMVIVDDSVSYAGSIISAYPS